MTYQPSERRVSRSLPSSIKKRSFRIKKRLSQLALFVIVLELISLSARLFFDADTLLAKIAKDTLIDQHHAGNAMHPYFGWVLNPDSELNSTYNIQDAEKNEFGFYGESPLANEGFRIAVLGGSVARDLANHPKWITDHIIHPNANVINLALGAYHQPQQLMVLNYFISLGAKFDVVINLDGVNELGHYPSEGYTKKMHYTFPRAWFLKMALYPGDVGFEQLFSLRQTQHRCQNIARSLQEYPWKLSSSFVLAGTSYCQFLRNRIQEVTFALSTHRSQEFGRFEQMGPLVEFQSAEDSLPDLVSLWAESSSLMHDICRARDILFIHFLQPNQYVANSKFMSVAESETAISETQTIKEWIEKGYPLAIQRGINIPYFVDLTLIFQKETSQVYSDNCCHFNCRGNKTIGKAVATEINSRLAADR